MPSITKLDRNNSFTSIRIVLNTAFNKKSNLFLNVETIYLSVTVKLTVSFRVFIPILTFSSVMIQDYRQFQSLILLVDAPFVQTLVNAIRRGCLLIISYVIECGNINKLKLVTIRVY